MKGTAATLLVLLTAPPLGASETKPLRVLAASSLTDVFADVAAAFEKTGAGRPVELGFAGSAILRAQVEHGAPGDVFASADLAQMAPLHAAGLASAPRVFARNRLVVAASTRSRRVRALADLAAPGVRVVLAGPTVPAGRYARETLRRVSAIPGYGADFHVRAAANVVSEETNVRGVLAKVALGEADAGLVYRTDVLAAPAGLAALEIPDAASVPAEYHVAVLAGAVDRERAEAFVSFLLSGEGARILARHGFGR
jgi:molybdate transport system substrate-binding protein